MKLFHENLHRYRRALALLIIALLLQTVVVDAATTRKAQIRWTGVTIPIAGDVDRDGYINVSQAFTGSGGQQVRSDLVTDPYRMWINDDDDYSGSETSGHDIPNSYASGLTAAFGLFGDYDHNDSGIDGTRDLVDFFPVYIDLHNLLQKFDTSPNRYQRRSRTRFAIDNYDFILKQEDEALNVVFTKMKKDQAGLYLTDRRMADTSREELLGDWHEFFGDDLDDIRTEHVTTDGVEIRHEFIKYVKDTADAGIVLLEGVAASDKPLQLVLKNRNTDQEYVLSELAVNIAPVTDYYRYFNLRGVEEFPPTTTAAAALASVSEPAAFKDSDSNQKHMIAVHGYNVAEEDARGWAAESFKRIWKTGSNAMFSFVTWNGNRGQLAGAFSPNYWTNVANALNTSESLSQLVNSLPGNNKSIMAHSLGNMVVGDAVANKSMSVDNYFMMDAAVALEAYDLVEITDASISRMRNPSWHYYRDPACNSTSCASDPGKPNERWLWSTEWHLQYGAADGRRAITWRNYLAGMFGAGVNIKNYYSSTEDVLENGDGDVFSFDALDFRRGVGYKSWTIQEIAKGTDIIAAILAEGNILFEDDLYGGWGYNLIDYPTNIDISFDYTIFYPFIDIDVDIVPLTPAQAFAQITPADIQDAPFFGRFRADQSILYGPASNVVSDAVVEPFLPGLLGHAIPALSDAAGRNPVTRLPSTKNFDMSANRNGWPAERGTDPDGLRRWRHSDLMGVAYLYVYKLYKDFAVNEAALNTN